MPTLHTIYYNEYYKIEIYITFRADGHVLDHLSAIDLDFFLQER